jgi:hypothetical protein
MLGHLAGLAEPEQNVGSHYEPACTLDANRFDLILGIP